MSIGVKKMDSIPPASVPTDETDFASIQQAGNAYMHEAMLTAVAHDSLDWRYELSEDDE